ncbi:AAA family ATPase [Methylobacter luteus]|uniref:AAA family ATPase n=1 Tax=Methylobacter luteus TaxID=415 RepID=UPI00041B247A|nr:ATP-binding protein [Methylobacter luteus]
MKSNHQKLVHVKHIFKINSISPPTPLPCLMFLKDQTLSNSTTIKENPMNGQSSELEDQIPLLRDLNEQRMQITQFLDEGLESLNDWLTDENKIELMDKEKTATIAIVVKAIRERSEEPPIEYIDYLKNLTLNHIVTLPHTKKNRSTAGIKPRPRRPGTPNPCSVLDAALVMQALVAIPGCAFTKPVFLCLYWIAREIYSVDYPDYGIGGARSSPSHKLISAFTTSECVKAITDFQHIFLNTATFFEQVDKFKTASDEIKILNSIYPSLKDWCDAEKDRLAHAYHTAQQNLSDALAFDLQSFPFNYKDTDNYLKLVVEEVSKVIRNSSATVDAAKKEIDKYRNYEIRTKPYRNNKARKLQTDLSHRYVLEGILKDAKSNADNALKAIDPSHFPEWKTLRDIFKMIDSHVYNILHPTQKSYLPSVLDREVSKVSAGEKRQWDPCEMVCAAASYGMLTNEWNNDHRLERAVRHLAETISDRGMFLRSRPIHVGDDRMTFVYNADILHAFAQLLKNMHLTNSVIQPELISKILNFFKDTREQVSPRKLEKTPGWHYEYFPSNTFSSEATAKAILALSMIHEMLNEQINNLVLDHFTVKDSKDLEKKPDLDDLFYPDYGLRLFIDKVERPDNFQFSEWPEQDSFSREESVAIALQRMRAHATCPQKRTETKNSDLCSLILHGPPGTGKTTLVEALAKTCSINMVEVTPSDIVVKGEEAIEKRARAVFEALSLLTRTVILFDEFDPVLWHRDPNDSGTRNVFSFLTPGMLPKLKMLNERAKHQSVAYVLVTNMIGSLDEAATREGRFDKKMGIYPPDVLSRLGRFVSQYKKMRYHPEPKNFEERVLNMVKKTSGAPMQTLSKSGWFTKPKQYITVMDQPESEAQIRQVIGEGKAAIKEYVQWWWITQWDENVRNNHAIVKFDQLIKPIPKLSKKIEYLRMSLKSWKEGEEERRKQRK